MLRAGWGNTKGGGVTSASGLAQLRFPRAKSQIVTQTCKQLGGAARLAGSPSQWGGAQVKTVTSRPTSSLLAPAPTPVIFFPWHRSLPSQLQEGDLRKSQSGLTARMGQRAEFSVKSGRIRSEALHSVQADWECWASLAHFPPL